MSSIWKSKFKKVKKYALSAIASLTLYILFYRIVLISLSIFRLKHSDFYIENLSYNSEKDNACQISVKSDAFSPLYIDFYASTASICFETQMGTVSFCELDFGLIELNKFGNIEFDSTIALNYIDVSKIPAFVNDGGKITLELSMVVSLRFLLIPLTFVVSKRLFKIDQKQVEDDADPYSKDKNTVIEEFSRSLNIEPGKFSRENFEKLNLLKSFVVQDVRHRGRRYNRVVLSLMPLHEPKFIKNINLHLENFHLNFTMPVSLGIIVKSMSVSSDGYKLDVLVPDIGSPNIIVKILQIYWKKRFIDIEVDQIWHYRPTTMGKKTLDEQNILVYQKSSGHNLVSLTVPFGKRKMHLFNGNWKIRDFHILPDKICWKCTINCNWKTLVLGRIMQQLLLNFMPEMSIYLNDSYLCTMKINLLNPLETIADCGSEFTYMAFGVQFDSASSIVLYSGRLVDSVGLSFRSCHARTSWLDKLKIQLKRESTCILVYENSMIEMFADNNPKHKTKAIDFLLEHRLRNPTNHELFALVTTFSNCKYRTLENLKLLVEFPEFTLRLRSPKECIQLKSTCQSFIGINFDEYNDDINELFYNVETELKVELLERYEKFDLSVLSDILSSNVVFEINDHISIPVKAARPPVIPVKTANGQSSFKVLSCLEVNYAGSESFFCHYFNVSPNCKIQRPEELADIERNSSFAIKNRIFLDDFTAEYKFLENMLVVHAKQPSLQIDVFETGVVVKALDTATVVVQVGAEAQNVYSAEDSVSLKLTSFFLTVDFSSFMKDKSEELIEVVRNSAISSVFKLSEENGILLMNFSVEIPRAILDVPAGLKLSIANALVLEISPNNDKNKQLVVSARVSQNETHSKISFSVNGILSFSARSYLVGLFADGNLVEERRVDEKAVRRLYRDVISVLEKKTKCRDRRESGIGDGENNMLHVEPVSFKSISRTEMEFGFRVYSEKLDDMVAKGLEDLFKSLPLTKLPNFIEISIEIVDLPSIVLSIVKPDESETPFLAMNNSSIIVSRKRYEVVHPIVPLFNEFSLNRGYYESSEVLEKIFRSNKKGMGHFVDHKPLKRLRSTTFEAPIQLKFSIDTVRLKEYKGTKEDERVRIVFAESNCRRIYKLLYVTANSMNIPLPNGFLSKTGRTALNMVYSVMDKFLPGQRLYKASAGTYTKVGAVLIKSKTYINVVFEPVSVFLVTPGGNMIHFRLFGLHFDTRLHGGHYQIVLPFIVYLGPLLVEITKASNRALSADGDELVFRLIIVFRGERHEIEIETYPFQPFEIIVRVFDGIVSECILPSYIHTLFNCLKQIGYFKTWFIDIKNRSFEEDGKIANIDAEEMKKDKDIALRRIL